MGKAAFGNELFAPCKGRRYDTLRSYSLAQSSPATAVTAWRPEGKGKIWEDSTACSAEAGRQQTKLPVTRCLLLFARVKAAITLAGETGKAVCTRNPNTDIGADPGKRFTVISINSLSPHGNNL